MGVVFQWKEGYRVKPS